jgi:hypothetical protein
VSAATSVAALAVLKRPDVSRAFLHFSIAHAGMVCVGRTERSELHRMNS